MINYIYEPVLFEVLGLKIYTWGAVVAIGFLLGLFFARKYSGINEKDLYNSALIIAVCGIVGGRLLYFAYYPAEFSFLNFFRVWQGGLSFFGGFILSAIAIIIYLKKQKLDVLETADRIIPWVVLGFLIGRVGCLIGDGGHVGKETEFFLGVAVNGVKRHWTALYSIFKLAALFLALVLLRKKVSCRKGFLFGLFLAGYGLLRFLLDFLRTDTAYFGLTIAQYLSIACFLIGLLIISWRQKNERQSLQHTNVRMVHKGKGMAEEKENKI